MAARPSFRPYLLVLAVVFAASMAFYALTEMLFWRARESATPAEAAARHLATGGLYQSFYVDTLKYKLAMYEGRRPDTVVLGSSRSMMIPERLMHGSVYNMGGFVYFPDNAYSMLLALLTRHTPGHVLYVADFWGYCDKQDDARQDSFADHDQPMDGYGGTTQLRQRFLIRQLQLGQTSVADLARVLSHRPARDDLPLQGLGASAARSGFGTDGALYSLGPAAPNRDDWLPDFPTTRRFIVNGESRFPRDCRLSGKSMAYFGKFLALARKHGIGVTVLVPPLPGQIHDAAGGLDYMHQAAERMRAMGVTVFDFLDGRIVDARDDEFYDGIHGGEAVLARVFLAMAADPAWADRVDTATARKSLAQSQGSPRQLAPRLD